MKLLSLNDVMERTGFDQDILRDLMDKDLFPQPRRIKPSYEWSIDSVEHWLTVKAVWDAKQ